MRSRFLDIFLSWARTYRTEIYIFLLAFGVRFVYAAFVQIVFGSHGFIAYSDAFAFYLRTAEHIVNDHIYYYHIKLIIVKTIKI